MACSHNVLYIESFDEFGPRTSCLLCDADVVIDQSGMEREWVAFDSQEPASYDAIRLHLERDTLLVRRNLFNH